jgi:tetratricopeptide (TPR) repeat protein
MQNSNLSETQPTRAIQNKKRKLFWLSWILFAFLAVAIFSLLGAMRGYGAGKQHNQDKQATARVSAIEEQYELGVSDLEAERYDLARQRFQFVLENDPGYPEVTDKLAEAMRVLYTTATPTPVPPTITPTPTRDLRPVEDIYTQAESYYAQGDWDSVINTLVSLREVDTSYRVVEVDSLLYRALRSRGLQKIKEQGSLEGGIYDLALAERFGPLDAEAITWRNLARLYMIGISFWEVIPEQAVYYFGQVVSGSGYLRDGSGWTARERYRAVLIQYGDQLARGEDWCSAQRQYELALSIRSDATIQATATFLARKCSPPTSTPIPITDTPTTTALITTMPTETTPVPATATATNTVPATTQPPAPTATNTVETVPTPTSTSVPPEPTSTQTSPPEQPPSPTVTSEPAATPTDTPTAE